VCSVSRCTTEFADEDSLPRHSATQTQHVVLWDLLRRIPNVTTLYLTRTKILDQVPGPVVGTVTAQDIHDICQLHPDLTMMHIDVALSFSRSNIPELPNDILEALARSKKSIRLMLYLHVHHPKTADFVLNRSIYYRIFNSMLEERERLELPSHPPFEVGFKIVQPWEKIKEHFQKPEDRLTWPEGTQKTSFETRVGPKWKAMGQYTRSVLGKGLKLRNALHRTLKSGD
jgi:hypothetical protein